MIVCGAFGLTLAGAASAATFDESVIGDFSTDKDNPTAIVLDLGANVIAGSSTSDPQDRDFVTFTVGAGQSLDSLILDSLTTSPGNRSFIAIDDQVGFDDIESPVGYVGFALVGDVSLGDDMLELLNDTNGDSPDALGPGTYTFWYQETGGPTSYSFTANLVPEPGSAVALLLGAGGLLARRRR